MNSLYTIGRRTGSWLGTVTLLLFSLCTISRLQAQNHPGGYQPGDAGPANGSVSIGMQYLLGDGMTPPSVKATSPSIDYPEIAMIQGLEGKVEVKALVTVEGKVTDLQILSSTDTVFSNAVLEGLSKFQFVPAKADGQPAEIWIRMNVGFTSQEAWTSTFEGEKVGKDGEDRSWAYVGDAVLPEINEEELSSYLAYPEEVRQRGAFGTVAVRVLVNTEGKVIKMEVEGDADAALAQAAFTAVSKSSFKPGTEAGKPSEMWTIIPIRFWVLHGKGMAEYQSPKEAEQNSPLGVTKPTYNQEELEKNFEYDGRLSEAIEVSMRVLVNETGKVEQVLVSSDVDPLITKAATAAVQKTKFTPGMQDGEAIPVWITVGMTLRPKAFGSGRTK